MCYQHMYFQTFKSKKSVECFMSLKLSMWRLSFNPSEWLFSRTVLSAYVGAFVMALIITLENSTHIFYLFIYLFWFTTKIIQSTVNCEHHLWGLFQKYCLLLHEVCPWHQRQMVVYGSRGWTFPAVFSYFLLLCDRWQQGGNLTQWWLMRKQKHVIEFLQAEEHSSMLGEHS